MFTGLIEELGTVLGVEQVPRSAPGARLVVEPGARPVGIRLSIATGFPDLKHGDSVAVDGVCLTAVQREPGRFTADVSAETLQKTTLGALAKGHRVNLERPLALGERLGGHLVLGHVDGVGEIAARDKVGEGFRFLLRLPEGLAKLVVSKGSIALDGISLTVNELLDPDRISLFIIPETLRATTWGEKGPGARVNVETDILGKHVARLLQFRE